MKIHADKDEGSDFKLHPDIPKFTSQNPILDSVTKAWLSERLANWLTDIANWTLLATTQLRNVNIDMDQQEIHRMTRKKRRVPFAQRRLEWRTDSDTLFSSVKYICGYRFVQIFSHLLTQYLWIVNLRREKDNHGSYQDHIREVGTPNILLTDNAKSQVGNDWTETSRKNKTQQIMSEPEN